MKEFLSQHHLIYLEKDISQDDKAFRELEQRNLMTTPVLIYGDEVIIGFDKKKLQQLL